MSLIGVPTSLTMFLIVCLIRRHAAWGHHSEGTNPSIDSNPTAILKLKASAVTFSLESLLLEPIDSTPP
jgi:hypothetical protein